MKTRDVMLEVSDHGVLRYLERRPLLGQGLPWVGVTMVVRAPPGDRFE
jgi:hypothetical protein